MSQHCAFATNLDDGLHEEELSHQGKGCGLFPDTELTSLRLEHCVWFLLLHRLVQERC